MVNDAKGLVGVVVMGAGPVGTAGAPPVVTLPAVDDAERAVAIRRP